MRWVLLVLLLTACKTSDGGAPEPAPTTTAAPTTPKWMDTFDAYPGAKKLCDEHAKIEGRDAQVSFQSFSTLDDAAAVRAFYASHGAPLAPQTPGRAARATNGTVLTVYALPTTDQYLGCPTEPAPDAKTLVVVSRVK